MCRLKNLETLNGEPGIVNVIKTLRLRWFGSVERIEFLKQQWIV